MKRERERKKLFSQRRLLRGLSFPLNRVNYDGAKKSLRQCKLPYKNRGREHMQWHECKLVGGSGGSCNVVYLTSYLLYVLYSYVFFNAVHSHMWRNRRFSKTESRLGPDKGGFEAHNGGLDEGRQTKRKKPGREQPDDVIFEHWWHDCSIISSIQKQSKERKNIFFPPSTNFWLQNFPACQNQTCKKKSWWRF